MTAPGRGLGGEGLAVRFDLKKMIFKSDVKQPIGSHASFASARAGGEGLGRRGRMGLAGGSTGELKAIRVLTRQHCFPCSGSSEQPPAPSGQRGLSQHPSSSSSHLSAPSWVCSLHPLVEGRHVAGWSLPQTGGWSTQPGDLEVFQQLVKPG